MAAQFTAASTQYLVNSAPPAVALPFSLGMWINATAADATTRTLWAYSDTVTTNNYYRLLKNTGEQIAVGARGGGTESIQAASLAISAGSWQFVLARFVSATNRRLSVLLHTGQITATQGTQSRTAGGLDTMTVGALSTSGGITEPWDGMIAEYWLASGDVSIDGVAAPEPFVRQLAYGGPLSVPNIAKDIIEYRSFRVQPGSDGDNLSEIFHGLAGRQTWANTNGATTRPHPPLPYWYVKPGQTQRVLTI